MFRRRRKHPLPSWPSKFIGSGASAPKEGRRWWGRVAMALLFLTFWLLQGYELLSSADHADSLNQSCEEVR